VRKPEPITWEQGSAEPSEEPKRGPRH